MSTNETRESVSCISAADAIALLEIIHKSLSCEKENDFRELFRIVGDLFPFEFAFAMLGRHDEKGILAAHGVNISFPEGWLREYGEKNYLQMDELVRENFTSFGVQNWPIKRKELHRKKEITSLGFDFGMRDCYTYGQRPAFKERFGSMFCFTGSSMEYEKRDTAILRLVGPHLHQALSRVYDKVRSQNENILLSTREKEVLEWLKQGKSSWDMSVILGISERTVNFHVHNIMRKLNATNRPQIIAVAAGLGLINFD
jgi:DNA-binding CsgD family transcriptional regulator